MSQNITCPDLVSKLIEENQKLKQMMANEQVYRSMIIHDLIRSPSVSIQQGLQQTIIILEQVKPIYNLHINFSRNLLHIQSEIDHFLEEIPSEDVGVQLNQLKESFREIQESAKDSLGRVVRKIETKLDEMDFIMDSLPRFLSESSQEVDEDLCEGSIQANVKVMNHNRSKLQQDRRQQVRADLLLLLKDNKIRQNSDQIEGVLDMLLGQYPDQLDHAQALKEQKQDSLLSNLVENLRKSLASILNAIIRIQEDFDIKYEMMTKKIDQIQTGYQSYNGFYTLQKKSIQATVKFYEKNISHIQRMANKAEAILQNQIYSQKLTQLLISDLLDVAKLQAGQFKINQQFFDLGVTIFEALKNVSFTAQEREIHLSASIENKIDLVLIKNVLGDQTRTLQMLLNFLQNSLKFTNKNGEVSIQVRVEKEETKIDSKDMEAQIIESNQDIDLNIRVFISVIDTGIGMSEEGISKLFTNFGKLAESASINQQGTGLGLSITKRVIEQMGGSVSVKSQVGEGSEFEIEQNMLCRVSQSELNKIQLSLRDGRNFRFVNKLFDEINFSSSIKGRIDNNLSKEFAEQRKQISFLSKKATKSPQFNSDANPERQMLQNISKQIEQMKSKRVGYQPYYMLQEQPSEQDKKDEKLCCLVANDDAMQLEFIKIIMEQLEIEVETAKNGLEALQKVQNKDIIGYDLIILDLNMPVMDGFTACQQILRQFKENNESKDSNEPVFDGARPVMVALSSHISQEIKLKSFGVGFDASLTSPLSILKARNLINNYFSVDQKIGDLCDKSLSSKSQSYLQRKNSLVQFQELGNFSHN